MGLKLEDSTIAQAQVRTILGFAHALRDAAGVSPQPTHSPISSSPRAVIDSVNLPNPPPVLPFLLEAGFSHEIALAASKVYELRSEELRRHVQESIITACHKIAELPTVALASSSDSLIRKVVSTFTEVYLRRLEQWREEVIQRIKQAPMMIPVNEVLRNPRTFNHEYVKLLEHFFEENPFPSHADKMFLAKKSNMEYRQIHVWFQNRRNRTKKEGKTLRKKPTYEGVAKPLDKLYNSMKGHLVDTNSQPPKSSKAGLSEGVTEGNMSKDVFVSSSPPHAFPSSYPPTCHYDPFPCKSGPVRFGKPEWRRVPDMKQPPSMSIGIDELVEKFSHLNVRDGTRPKGSPKLQSNAATVAITVVPSRAPHPSLIVRKYSRPTNMVQLRPPVRAPVSYSKAFQSPSPTSKPVTLVPLSAPPNKNKHPGKRKIASLPQRFPGRIRNASRDNTLLESSSTSSPSPRLFSTDSESRSCSFSSSSSLSTPSDASSVRELPHLFGSPCRSPSTAQFTSAVRQIL